MELGSASAHELNNEAELNLEKMWEEDDKISEFPDEILTSILSFLTLKEAARSSVLSHRWEKLWTFYTGCLDFDKSLSIPKVFYTRNIERNEQLREPERQKYVDWVNQVLASLDGALPSLSSLDGFRVCFDLPRDQYGSHIDKWIQFVLDKRVRSLELDFSGVMGACDPCLQYRFPVEIFNNYITRPRGSYNIPALTSICFKTVGVSGDVIECFLCNCPFLERLCVNRSGLLINLKVRGATLVLKYIEIVFCNNLKSVEVSAPNLVSFHYQGSLGCKMNLNVENAPRLINVFLGGWMIPNVMYMLRCLSRYFSQLETLKLRTNMPGLQMYDPDFQYNEVFQLFHFDNFSKLKHLNLTMVGPSELLRWTVLIDASPVLHKLTVEVELAYNADLPKWTNRGEVRKCPHECLRVVEFVGFVGGQYDVDLIMHLFANARNLEKLIINCSDPLWIGKPYERMERLRKAAEDRAMELKTSLPSQVELVII